MAFCSPNILYMIYLMETSLLTVFFSFNLVANLAILHSSFKRRVCSIDSCLNSLQTIPLLWSSCSIWVDRPTDCLSGELSTKSQSPLEVPWMKKISLCKNWANNNQLRLLWLKVPEKINGTWPGYTRVGWLCSRQGFLLTRLSSAWLWSKCKTQVNMLNSDLFTFFFFFFSF